MSCVAHCRALSPQLQIGTAQKYATLFVKRTQETERERAAVADRTVALWEI